MELSSVFIPFSTTNKTLTTIPCLGQMNDWQAFSICCCRERDRRKKSENGERKFYDSVTVYVALENKHLKYHGYMKHVNQHYKTFQIKGSVIFCTE